MGREDEAPPSPSTYTLAQQVAILGEQVRNMVHVITHLGAEFEAHSHWHSSEMERQLQEARAAMPARRMVMFAFVSTLTGAVGAVVAVVVAIHG